MRKNCNSKILIKKYITKVLSILTCLFCFGCQNSTDKSNVNINDNNVSAFNYTIRPISLSDRVNLDIEVTFKGNSSGVTEISLPVDKYGTKNIYESVACFYVNNATVSTVFEKPEIRIVRHKPNQVLIIKYTISFDPKLSATSSFSPIIESKNFHFFSPQWTLRTDNDGQVYNYSIQFKNLPKDWVSFSNLKQKNNQLFATNSKQSDFKPFIAGGIYSHSLAVINSKPVNIIISHHFKDENLINDVTRLMTSQRDFFDFITNEHYLVSITKRDGILAGTAIENAFVCLLRNNAQRHDVLNLLAHETMHNWVPLMADIERDEKIIGSEFSTEFFNEGFISYAPKVLLYEDSLITKKNVVELMNKTLFAYAINPFNDITLEDIQKAQADREFNNYHEKVSYYRGELLAFKWDNIIRKKTSNKENILHFIKNVIAKATQTQGKISFENFHKIASSYGIDSKTDWINHIENGNMISLKSASWLENDYQLENKKDEKSKISYQTLTKR